MQPVSATSASAPSPLGTFKQWGRLALSLADSDIGSLAAAALSCSFASRALSEFSWKTGAAAMILAGTAAHLYPRCLYFLPKECVSGYKDGEAVSNLQGALLHGDFRVSLVSEEIEVSARWVGGVPTGQVVVWRDGSVVTYGCCDQEGCLEEGDGVRFAGHALLPPCNHPRPTMEKGRFVAGRLQGWGERWGPRFIWRGRFEVDPSGEPLFTGTRTPRSDMLDEAITYRSLPLQLMQKIEDDGDHKDASKYCLPSPSNRAFGDPASPSQFDSYPSTSSSSSSRYPADGFSPSSSRSSATSSSHHAFFSPLSPSSTSYDEELEPRLNRLSSIPFHSSSPLSLDAADLLAGCYDPVAPPADQRPPLSTRDKVIQTIAWLVLAALSGEVVRRVLPSWIPKIGVMGAGLSALAAYLWRLPVVAGKFYQTEKETGTSKELISRVAVNGRALEGAYTVKLADGLSISRPHWQEGLPTGQVTIIRNGQKVLEGNCDAQGRLVAGWGTRDEHSRILPPLYVDGEVAREKGQFVNGKLHGQGERWENGTLYRGRFEEGQFLEGEVWNTWEKTLQARGTFVTDSRDQNALLQRTGFSKDSWSGTFYAVQTQQTFSKDFQEQLEELCSNSVLDPDNWWAPPRKPIDISSFLAALQQPEAQPIVQTSFRNELNDDRSLDADSMDSVHSSSDSDGEEVEE